MVRHGLRGAFWWRLTGVGARRREAPHAQPAHCLAASAVTQLIGTDRPPESDRLSSGQGSRHSTKITNLVNLRVLLA